MIQFQSVFFVCVKDIAYPSGKDTWRCLLYAKLWLLKIPTHGDSYGMPSSDMC